MRSEAEIRELLSQLRDRAAESAKNADYPAIQTGLLAGRLIALEWVLAESDEI
jgi:hypothetical protein